MKRIVTLLLVLAMASSLTACGKKQEISSQQESSTSTKATENSTDEIIQPQTISPTKLTNKMTDNELQWVDKHELTLLDEFPKPNTDPNAEHKVSIEFQTLDTAEWRKSIEEYRDKLTENEYNRALGRLQKAEETGEPYQIPLNVLVDGYLVQRLLPDVEDFSDGLPFSFTAKTYNENGEPEAEKQSFDNMEDYLEYIRQKDTESGYSDEETELEVLYVKVAYDALKSGNYETLPEGSVNINDESINYRNAFHNYRSDWEFDLEAVEEIKDSVDEIRIFDDEFGKNFTVHVTLPPDYDKNKTYPVFFLTDGIWRFGNCPELRKCMENGEAAPVILVSLYYSYDVTDPDMDMRFVDLVLNRKELLDFITDNLMPYLCENYNIDCADSTLYGHSDGGVFTHYAMFNSDKYENQPFGHYIIGSPAFWGLYHHDKKEYVLNDYDYFDRNEKLNKTVFLCAGSLEDPDYEDVYREGDDTTLEGVAKLKERLEAHGADLTYKLYESHHYQFIPEMLVEYLKATYPCCPK
ncbi:MAG: alpha/beta hydrolase [Ruminococcus sp.]|nr:alpha/beta hydrolase [Ruminococcus sp.]